MSDRPPKILLVDDGARYVEIAHALLRDYDWITRCELTGPCWTCPHEEGCTLTHAHDWSETVQALAKHADVDVVLLDVVFELPRERLLLTPDGDIERSRRFQGIEILRRLRERFDTLPVVLMTSKAELSFEWSAEALLADEYVTLAETDAFDARAIGLLIERILARRAGGSDASDYVWGTSPEMARLQREAGVLARTSLPMLILGEAGTGKSALAERVIHPLSMRSGPFVVADLAAVPENLTAATLFGTVEGAFSGAVDREGWLERASGGTLFLDEIGTLSPEIQRMLLVTLQNGRYTRLGDLHERTMDVKLLVGTNTDLQAAVRQGRFRADLFARLNPAAALTVPPLKGRMADLEILAGYLVAKTFSSGVNQQLLGAYMATAGLGGARKAGLLFRKGKETRDGVDFVLSSQSRAILRKHPFPGNIRELEFLLANATLFSLSDALRAAETGRAATDTQAKTIFLPEKLIRELVAAPQLGAGDKSIGNERYGVTIAPADTLRAVARDLEIQIMKQLYSDTDGDFEAMAGMLLKGDPLPNARRVRLRFNQLGLRVIRRNRKRQNRQL